MHRKWISSCTFYRTFGHVFVVQQHIICIFVIRWCQLQARLLFHRFNALICPLISEPRCREIVPVEWFAITLSLSISRYSISAPSPQCIVQHIAPYYTYIHPQTQSIPVSPHLSLHPGYVLSSFLLRDWQHMERYHFHFLATQTPKEIIHLANVLQFKSRDSEVMEVIWRNVSTQLWIPPMFVDPIMTSITSWLFFGGDESHGDWHQSAMTSGAPQAPTDPTDTPEKLKSLLRAPLSPQKLKQKNWPPRTHQKISKVILSSSPNRAKIKTPHSKFESN